MGSIVPVPTDFSGISMDKDTLRELPAFSEGDTSVNILVPTGIEFGTYRMIDQCAICHATFALNIC